MRSPPGVSRSLADGPGAAADGTLARGAAPKATSAAYRLRRRFRPELVPTLVLLAVLALTLSAGRWQLGRAEQKVELQQRMAAAAGAPAVDATVLAARDPAGFAWQPVSAVGRFDAARVVFLDNRLRDGVAGYEVLTPLRLAGSHRVLLINRGWIAAPPQRDRLPSVRTPEGEVRVTGVAVLPSARFMELREGTDEAARWQNWTIERARSRWSLDLLPFALLLEQPAMAAPDGAALDDGLARNWPRPDVGIDKHRGYALQWFSFALIAVVVWAVLGLRRVPEEGADDVARPA